MKFDKPTTEAILKDIKDEIPYRFAAESNGIHLDTFCGWVRKGLRDIKLGKSSYYAQFAISLREIEKSRIKKHIKNIAKGRYGHKGSEWLLERSFWKYFSSKAAELDLNERITNLENKGFDSNADKTEEDKNE